MTFDKKEYWENREAGKRGQGEKPEFTTESLWTKQDYVAGKCKKSQIGDKRSIIPLHLLQERGKLKRVNRAMYRKNRLGNKNPFASRKGFVITTNRQGERIAKKLYQAR